MTPLAVVASLLAGRPTAVVCVPGRRGGLVWFHDGVPDPVIILPAGMCLRLATAQTAPVISPADFLVFEHEALHIRLASVDECLVERAALANVWQAVRAFRLPAWRARVVLAGVAIADAAMSAAYHPDPMTGAC